MREAEERCQMCRRKGGETGHGYLVVDHDARLGNWAVRGLLCSRCNLIVGYNGDGSAEATRYLADPWHARHRPQVAIQQPPVGARIVVGRRPWRRNPVGWEPQDRLGGGVLEWEGLVRKYGTHALARENGIEGDPRYIRDGKVTPS